MSKIVRNLSTEESRRFWAHAEAVAEQVKDWPASRRAGINVAPPAIERDEPKG